MLSLGFTTLHSCYSQVILEYDRANGASYHILQNQTGGGEACRENSFLLEGWRSDEVSITLLFGFPIGANETKKDLQSSVHVDRTRRVDEGKG
jgi:hypothetical protein